MVQKPDIRRSIAGIKRLRRAVGIAASPAPTKVLAPTLSEVQQAYVAGYSLEGVIPWNRKGHEAPTVPKQGNYSKSEALAATPLSRQSSRYGDHLGYTMLPYVKFIHVCKR
jgi:hypothetical protein